MASPFARVVAQLVVAGAGILSRAFVSAYSQAVHNARQGTVESAKSMSHKSKLSAAEALQVLNLRKEEMKEDLVQKKFNHYFEINDPDKGGSFYLQSKVYRAREALMEQLALTAKQSANHEEFLKRRAEGGGRGPGGRARAGGSSAGEGVSEEGVWKGRTRQSRTSSRRR